MTESICDGDSYTVGTSTYTTAGTYSDVLTASNGCDSTVNLTLTILPTFTTDLTESICEGDSYTVGTSTYTTAGTYSDELTAGNGCDSTVNLTLTILPTFTTDLTESICDGDSYTVGTSHVYTTAGTYSDVLTASNGCDSTVNLTLTILPTFTTDLTESICDGDSYTVGTSTYTTAGTYSDVLTASNGCDSTVNLTLTILPTFTTDLTESICDGDSYTVGTSTYTTAGTYSDVLTASNGCDSMVNLTLTILPTFTTDLTESICDGDSYTVGTSTYTTAGTYTDVLNASNGCDSTVNLTLTVRPSDLTNEIIGLCIGQLYNGIAYTSDTIIVDSLLSSIGCDSVVITAIQVGPSIEITEVASICEGDSYAQGLNVYTTSGIYVDTLQSSSGCDSIVTLDLSVNPVFHNGFN